MTSTATASASASASTGATDRATTSTRALLRFATAGSVDDGKSTLVGRLLHDSRAIADDQLEAVRRTSAARGFGGRAVGGGATSHGSATPDSSATADSSADDNAAALDLALLTDGLRAEREQGITIDVAYRYFSTDRRSFILADCPGHVQYTRNMVTGATTADAVVLLVDVRHGVREQTRRHLGVVHLLRVPHVVIAVNKIDLVGYTEAAFRTVEADIRSLAAGLDLADLRVVPVSALSGDNVVRRSDRTPWYDGPALLDLLEALPVAGEVDTETGTDARSTRAAADQGGPGGRAGDRSDAGAGFRFPVQLVARAQGDRDRPDFRGYAGRVASGRIRVGDPAEVWPGGGRTSIAGIDEGGAARSEAGTGRSVLVRLADELDLARGGVIAAEGSLPAPVEHPSALLFHLDPRPLVAGARVLVRWGTATVPAIITELAGRRDPGTLALEPADELRENDIGAVRLRLATALPLEAYAHDRRAGAFLVVHVQDGATLAAGIVA